MREKNKDLENLKNKDKNWLLPIGIGLLLFSIIIALLLFLLGFVAGGGPPESGLVLMGLIIYFVFPTFVLSLILIFTSLLLRIQNKKIRITSIILLIIFVFGIIGQLSFYSLLLTWPFEGLAKLTKSETVCRYIPVINDAGKDACYFKVASAKKDISICSKITGEWYKMIGEWEVDQPYCIIAIAIALNDSSICENLPEGSTFKQICYQKTAENIRDPLECNQFQDPELKDECYNNVFYKAESPDVCEKVEESDLKDECYYTFVWRKYNYHPKEASKDQTLKGLCEKISNRNERGRCYSLLAKVQNNLGFCEKIEAVELIELKDQCKLEVRDNSISTLGYYDASFCEELQTQAVKDKCYKHLACYRLGNQAFCEKIKDLVTRDDCYCSYAYSFAIMGGVAEVKKIKDQSIRDNCYFNLAKTHPALTPEYRQKICWDIQDKYLKQKCENLFQQK